ncbi:MAG: ABC transporter substrate-binding protein [Ktedonobacterales bacterium]
MFGLQRTQRRHTTARHQDQRHHPRRMTQAALALLGLAALLVSACAPGTTQSPLAKNQVFVWPYSPFNPTQNSIQHDAVLDPAASSFANDSGNLGMLYAGLVTFDSNLSPVPDAATWDISGNGTIYTFHLKHTLKFSDGTPLTASDYAYSIDRSFDPHLCDVADAKTYGPNAAGTCPGVGATGAGGLGSGYLSAIIGASQRVSGAISTLVSNSDDPNHGINVVDQYTLRIRLSTPAAYFLEAMTYPTSYPVEKKLVEQYPGGLWVDHLDQGGCSGPFMVKSYNGGKQLTMVPNPAWEQAWNTPLKLTEVDRPYVDTLDHEYTAYRAGQYDYTSVPGSQYTFARGEDDFNEVPTLVTQYFGLNFKLPPFDKLEVRRAFDLALNKQYLVDSIVHGASVPTNHIVPRGMPGFNNSLLNPPALSSSAAADQSLTGNQTAATAYIKQAATGCATPATPPGTPPATLPDYCPFITGSSPQPIIIYVSASNQTRVDLARGAAAQWSSVLGLNVQVKVDGRTWSTCVNAANTTCQAWAVGWLADYPDPQDFLSLQFASGAANNTIGIANHDLDQLFAKADAEQNPAARAQEYAQAEQQLVNDVAWLPYAQDKLYWRQRSWVHGFGLNALQLIVDTDWAKIYISQH